MAKDGSWDIQKTTLGDPIKELLTCRNYEPSEMIGSYLIQVRQAVEASLISEEDGAEIAKKLEKYLDLYPYLVK